MTTSNTKKSKLVYEFDDLVKAKVAERYEMREQYRKALLETSGSTPPPPPPPLKKRDVDDIPFEETEKGKEYMKYERSVNESQGFDIVDYEGAVYRHSKINDVETRKSLDSIVKLAMDKYNQTHKTDFEIIEIKHSNDAATGVGLVYYITFTAMKMDEKEKITFQAQGYGGANNKFYPNPTLIYVGLKPL